MASGNAGTKLKLTFNRNGGYTNGGGSGMVSDDD